MTLRTCANNKLTAGCCALLLGAFAACSSKDSTAALASSKLTIKGTVTDESGAAVANATVVAGDVTVVTDAQGGYVAQPNYKLGEVATFVVSKDKFGTRNQVVAIDLIGVEQDFVLRPVSASQTVTLATAVGANVQIAFPGNANDGGLTLSIPANALVTAAGQPAQGNVEVDLTYWSPNDPLTNTPAPMVGYDASNPNAIASALISYGMGDIQVKQNGQALQVAGGANLQLSFTVPPTFADQATNVDPNDDAAPQLWSVDENKGVWVKEGSMASGRVSWDPNTNQIHAALPHLSAWNIDGIDGKNGCVTGKLVDCKGNAVANTQAWLWMVGKGTIGHAVLQSGGDGTFCGSVTGAGALTSKSTAVGEAYTWVSLPSAPQATSTCNPSGYNSYAEACPLYPASSLVCRTAEKQTRYDAGIAKCKTPLTSFTMCGYCAGTPKPSGKCTVRQGNEEPYKGLPFVSGQCTNLGNVQIQTANCGVVDTSDPCKGKGDMTGVVCSKDSDCCPTKSLVCNDGRCVPRTQDVN